MSNLYYGYRGDSAGQQRPPAAQSQHHLPQQTPVSKEPLAQLHQGVALRSPAQPSLSFSTQQAWAPDQPAALHNHHPQPSQPSVNTPFQPSPSRPAQASLPMNATRQQPLSSRQPQYDDNLFHVMGKPFAESNSRHLPSSSPASDQYSQLRPSSASNVFDPSEFPTLGGAMHNSGSIQPSQAAQSLLSTSAPPDTSGLSNVALSASALNGLAHYTDLYSMAPYGDGRGKAVDALTGASANAEFSMQSEDFPALGGGASEGGMRPPNGASSLAPGSARAPASSMDRLPGSDTLYERNIPPVNPSQPQLVMGRGQLRGAERPSNPMLIGRAGHVANGYQISDGLPSSSVNHLDRGNPLSSLHQPRSLEELSSASSPPRGALHPPPHAQQIPSRGKGPLPEVPRRGDDLNVLARRDARSRQNTATNTSKLVPNGDAAASRATLSNGPAVTSHGGSSLVLPEAEKGQDEMSKASEFGPSTADKYGMKALLPVVLPLSDGSGKAENILSIGLDLTALGLNLNSPDPLHKTFENPWEGGQGGSGPGENSGSSPKNQEPEYKLPTCYYMQPPALRSSHFTKFQLETLFYIFYNMPRDVLQLLAAVELYNRKWRYHKDLKLWFTCDSEANGGYDNRYIYFDIKSWERRQFHEAGQSFVQGLMTDQELNAVKIPPL